MKSLYRPGFRLNQMSEDKFLLILTILPILILISPLLIGILFWLMSKNKQTSCIKNDTKLLSHDSNDLHDTSLHSHGSTQDFNTSKGEVGSATR